MTQIVTDSSTLYTKEEALEHGFESIPLCISIGDLEGRDLQVDMDAYYQRIAEGQIPRTSQPPIGDVIDCYERYPDDEIINITMADGLSGTYQSACSARELVPNKERIHVFNTRTLCGPHRYMTEMAQKLKEEGRSTAEILEWLRKKADQTESFLIPQDFRFLQRGGRLTPMAAALGSLLNLKPVMCLTEDGKHLDKFAVKRTMASAVKSIMNHLREKNLGIQHILYISHANAPEEAQKIKALFQAVHEKLEIHILELSPVFVAQGGPKCIAIQYIEK